MGYRWGLSGISIRGTLFQSKSKLNSVRELPYSLARIWVGGGTVFPKGIRSLGPNIAPDRIPYDTGIRENTYR